MFLKLFAPFLQLLFFLQQIIFFIWQFWSIENPMDQRSCELLQNQGFIDPIVFTDIIWGSIAWFFSKANFRDNIVTKIRDLIINWLKGANQTLFKGLIVFMFLSNNLLDGLDPFLVAFLMNLLACAFGWKANERVFQITCFSDTNHEPLIFHSAGCVGGIGKWNCKILCRFDVLLAIAQFKVLG